MDMMKKISTIGSIQQDHNDMIKYGTLNEHRVKTVKWGFLKMGPNTMGFNTKRVDELGYPYFRKPPV